MRLSGPSPNREAQLEALIETLLDGAGRASRTAVLHGLQRMKPCPPNAMIMRPRQGIIQQAVVEVLQAAALPLSIPTVCAAVTEHMGQPVSAHTVRSVLSVAARNGRFGIARVGTGAYAIRSPR